MDTLAITEKVKPSIKKILPFKYLSDKEVEFLMGLISIHSYNNEVIIKQGEMDQSLYAVLKGSVKVTVNNNLEESYICTLGVSEVFGEAGMFMNAERTANVTALDKTIIMKITRESMMIFIKEHPNASNKVFMIMIYSLLQKLKEANRELAYERKSDYNQADIDSLINNLITS